MFNGVPNTYTPTQSELDKIKYSKRASVIPEIMSQMATENMDRVRAGTWTVSQLIGLTQDAQLKEILTDLYSLSFEIAYGKIDGIANSIVTTEIKNGWKAKLAANFY